MLDVGWSEILVIAIVLIVVVGPKELPQMLRTFGRMVSKMRGMAGEFRQQFDEALREADMDDVRKTLSDAQKLNPLNTIREAVNPLRQVGNEIRSDIEKTVRTDPAPKAAEPVAVPSEAEKPAAAEPVPAAPLKAGAVSKTEPVETPVIAAKQKKPRKAADKAVKAADKPAVKKPASRKPKTKKDEA